MDNQNTSSDDSVFSNVNIDIITSTDSNKESIIEKCEKSQNENENNVTISLIQSTPENIKNVPDNFNNSSNIIDLSSVLIGQLSPNAAIADTININNNNNSGVVNVGTTIIDSENINLIEKLTDIRNQIDIILQTLKINIAQPNVLGHPKTMMITKNNDKIVNTIGIPKPILKSTSSNRRHSISTPPLPQQPASTKQIATSGAIKKTASFNNTLFYVSPYAFNRNNMSTSTSTVKRSISSSSSSSNTTTNTVTPMSRNVVKKYSINNSVTTTTGTTTTTTSTNATRTLLSKSVSKQSK